MDKWKWIIHWSSYVYFLYVFGYASLFKIFQKKTMIHNMAALGFNKAWTMAIGVGEFIGVILLLVGLFKPSLKSVGVLFLIPFAMGAFVTHMAHNEYRHFYNALVVCILSVVILWTDQRFKIVFL